MNKVYNRIIWQNQPSTATALGATNLNKMDIAMNTIDDRVVAMDTAKANQSTVNELVKSITYNKSNGVITITKQNGTSTTIDTKLEKLAVNFTYNPTTQKLIITLDDKTTQEVDLSSLISQYEFLNSDTVAFTLVDGKVKANVINGSITANYLQPNYLADITVQAQTATAQANKSKRYAVGGVETGDATDNAKYYKEQAELFKNQAKTYRDEAEDISGVGVAAKDKLGLVNGNGNVEVRTTGDMWADQYKDKVTALTGTFITCPVADNGLAHVNKIVGDTVQKVTVQGKNICPTQFSEWQSGSYTVTGGTQEYNTRIRLKRLIRVTASTQYFANTFSNMPDGKKLGLTIRVYDANGVFVRNIGIVENTTFVIMENEHYISVTMFNTVNDSDMDYTQYMSAFSNKYVQPLICLGTDVRSLEEYTPNSPSPDYPSTLEYAKEFDVITSNTNILDITTVTHYPNKQGITSVLNSDGTVTVNGTSTIVYTIIFDKMINLPPGTYRVDGSGMVNGVRSVYAQISLQRKDGTISYISDGSFIVNDTVASIRFAIQTNNVIGTVFNNVSLSPRITVGITKLDYEQHKGDKESISLPFIGLPNGTKNSKEYVDGIFSDVIRGKEIRYDGSSDEGWTLQSINANGIANFQIGLQHKTVSGTSVTALCNRLVQDTIGIANVTREGFLLGSGNTLWIRVNSSRASTVAEFRTWLANNNVMIQYELPSTIITPTDEIYLETYKGITNLFTNIYPQVEMTVDFKSELWSDISKTRKLFYSFKEVDSTFSRTTPLATIMSKMPKDSTLMVSIDNVDDTEYIDSGDLVIRKTSSSFAVATHTSWERNIWTSVWTGAWSGWSGFPLDTENFALFMGTSSDTVNLPNKFPTSQVTFGLNQKINSVDSKVNTIIWNQETLTPVAPNVSSVMNGSVQYYKSNGVVCISVYDGQLKSPMTVGQLITLFTLPAGLRPVLQMRFPLTWTDNKYAIMLIVDADGAVKLYSRHNATIPALTPDFMGSASFSVRTMD